MMKKIILPLFALVAVHALAGNKLNLNDSLTSLRHIERERIQQFTLTPEAAQEFVFWTSSDRVYWHRALDLMWPVTVNGRHSEVLEAALAQALGRENTTTLNQLLKDFDNEVPNVDLEPKQIKKSKAISSLPDDSGAVTDYDVRSLNMVGNDGKLFVFHVGYGSCGIGAAHGMYGSGYVNYYEPNDKVLVLDDVVRGIDNDALARVITQALMNKEGVTTMEQLRDDKGYFIYGDLVPVSGVFYCTERCLHFIYQPYEIASYADGIIDIEVWDFLLEDAGLLTPLGKRVLTK